ncbi:MAG: serine/threonine-protein kinase [Planctomycetota bacterium]|nr:serine/threonine-protein kinase [Planctomycetota bacterium]
MRCPSCQATLTAEARFCPSCGRAINPAPDAPTVDPGPAVPTVSYRAPEPPPRRDPPPPPASAPRLASSSFQGRFTPGQVLAGRYRILNLLGQGGMGEVYRADDLTLGQPVALKFLPVHFTSDPQRLQRFLAEVRTTRQISHPAVCRVYDVEQIDDAYCLAMEYIDGEDLASLLRRIGRLPEDKALEIARQLCAGLAAAHDLGVIHRDLKPANIMIDGRGRARIADFGVAGVAAALNASGDITAGTPAYMAPEQLAGTAVTTRSDLYSLGLVLYELFTGRPVWADKASSLAELRRLHESHTPQNLSSHVSGIDPLIERVILRCLEHDPDARPRSALAVAAALPGGDPLAAALAAGETPSPEMVAASSRDGVLRRGRAIAWLASVLIGLALILAIERFLSVPLENVAPLAPGVLKTKAEDIISALGDPSRPADYAYGFSYSTGFSNYQIRQALARNDPHFWGRFSDPWAPVIRFFYRRAAHSLQSSTPWSSIILLDNPRFAIEGEVRVELDARARLLRYERIPDQVIKPSGDSTAGPPAPPPTGTLFDPLIRAAGFDPAALTSTEPRWTPHAFADHRAAWTAAVPSDPPMPVRLEAASLAGSPVFFRVINEWTEPERTPPELWGTGVRRIFNIFGSLMFVLAILGASFLAWRHARLGRTDFRGAAVIATSVFLPMWVGGVFAVQNPATIVSLYWLGPPLYYALYNAALTCLCYLAIEPVVRRLWPDMLVSWARVLTGQLRDPLIGRDVLLGTAMGIAFQILLRISPSIGRPFGSIDGPLGFTSIDDLRGVLPFIAVNASGIAVGGILIALLITMLLIGCRVLTRSTRRASIVFFLVLLLIQMQFFSVSPGGFLLSATAAGLLTFTLTRIGLLAMITFLIINNVILEVPLTLDASHWAFGYTLAALGATVLLAGSGFLRALGSQKLVTEDPLA